MTAPRTEFRVPMRLAYLLVQHDRVEALAKQAPALAARNEKLHLDTVDLSAQHFDRLSRVDLNLVGMNAEAQPVEQIDCELGISNCLCAVASTAQISSM